MTGSVDPASAGIIGDGGAGPAFDGPAPAGRPSSSELARPYVEAVTVAWISRGVIPEFVVRSRLDYPCGARHPVTDRPCEKRPGHHLFRDGRRYHRANQPHVEPLRSVYPATWVHVWR